MRFILSIGIVCGFLSWPTNASAQEPKPSPQPKAPVPSKGLRVMFNGNSWFNFVPGGVADQVKAAGIEGHREVRFPKPNDFSPIEAGEVDVYAHGVHWWMEVPWSHGVTAEKIVGMGLKANANFRAYYHAAWLVGDGRAKEIKTKADYDDSKLADVQAALDKTRKGVEGIVEKLNEKFGKRVVFLVPVGNATVKLRELILKGKYPGVKKQSELWTDAMPHPAVHVMALSGYCHFAAIYHTSPVGLKIDRFKELTDEQHAILQKLAWETVSKYPHAGVAAALDPKSTPATNVPVGLRVAGAGNSWYSENCEPLCKAAGIAGHKKIRGINGNRIEHVTPLLEKGEIDAFVYGRTDIGTEPKLLSALMELGPKHNSNFRGIYIQMPWLVHDGRQGVKSADEYEKTDLAEMQVKLEKSRKQQEAWADKINTQAGKRVVFLVPLGDGMLEVRKMIAAGKFPGVTKQSGGNSVLRGDIMPHQGLLGFRLGAYMHFAALYRMSPEGLKFPGKDGDGLTDEQRPILQKLAWDMVSKYPYAGLAEHRAKTVTNSIGMKLARIPAGEFPMGSALSEKELAEKKGWGKLEWYGNEFPQHRVRITKPYYLSAFEVTQKQYERVTGNKPSSFQGANLPVEKVSWTDAARFCRKLSQLEGRKYRLPTEAEMGVRLPGGQHNSILLWRQRVPTR
jgi:hypothetical protein